MRPEREGIGSLNVALSTGVAWLYSVPPETFLFKHGAIKNPLLRQVGFKGELMVAFRDGAFGLACLTDRAQARVV